VIPEAELTGRCEIRSNSYVIRVETNDKGRATGVAYYDANKHEQFQKAQAVVVCANGGETPRLLLNSATPRYPHGLANSSGLVGKYLMFNQGSGVHAVFEHELNEYKSVQATRVVHDFYESDPKRGYYGGGGIDARINPQPAIWALTTGPDMPVWGEAYKERLEAFPRSMVCAGHTTSLAVDTNSVSIDPDLKDAWGIPSIRTTYKDHPDDLAFARFLQDRSFEIMDAAGAKKIWREDVSESNFAVHLLGTCRMGNDPKNSVIDKYHRTHDVRNLFLCDGSSFVTSGRGQPTMTIQALAFRAADHIAQFARKNEI
jgi:choline dehydrogenase-like flavoprotein